MALPSNTGYLDEIANAVFPNNTGTWADQTSWSLWRSWITSPADPLIYVSDIVDLGEERSFCLKIITDATGTVSYDVYTSNTGLFAGEETVVNIASGDEGVSSFSGRFYAVAVKVSNTGEKLVLNAFEMTATEQTISFDMNAINTSSLQGTINARELNMPRSVSQIVSLQITPHTVSAYNMDVYVSDHVSSTTVVPRIISKDPQTPTIALVGLDNVARDAVVDIHVRALPEQYMSGNNLLVR